MESNKDKLIIICLVGVYTVINILSVIIPFIPGFFEFVFWGFVAPIMSISISWFQVKKYALTRQSWIIISGVLSIYFTICGTLSFLFITALWASV